MNAHWLKNYFTGNFRPICFTLFRTHPVLYMCQMEKKGVLGWTPRNFKHVVYSQLQTRFFDFIVKGILLHESSSTERILQFFNGRIKRPEWSLKSMHFISWILGLKEKKRRSPIRESILEMNDSGISAKKWTKNGVHWPQIHIQVTSSQRDNFPILGCTLEGVCKKVIMS